MNKIYQKVFSDTKISANPQSDTLTQAVISGVDRQPGNEETFDKRTGSRVHARDDGRWRKGFTLIELLVVVLIIGVLAAVALPQYQKAVARSRASELQLLMRSIALAKQDYYLANATHARSFSDLAVSLPANCTTQANDYYGESAACKDNISLFLDTPGHDAAGVLSGLGDGSRFWLYYHPLASRKLCASCPGGENYARSLCLGLGFPASSEHDNGSGCSEFVE